MPDANYLPVQIQNVARWRMNVLVLLRHADDDSLLHIVIAEPEARAIVMALNKRRPQRPLTHDLTHHLLQELGARIEKVHISDLRDNTYYAVIYLEHGGRTLQIDARPSDAMALAVRFGAPIFVREDILRENAMSVSEVTFERLHDGADDDAQQEPEPEPTDPVAILQRQLDSAIAAENYEEAARLRDQLQNLDSGN